MTTDLECGSLLPLWDRDPDVGDTETGVKPPHSTFRAQPSPATRTAAPTGGSNLDRWLTRAIRITALLLVVAVGSLAAYWYAQRHLHANLSLVDRDIQILQEQVLRQPNDPGLRVAMANLYLEKGRYDEAILQAEQVLQVNPDHLGALLTLGQACARIGSADRAAGYLSRILELNRDNPLARSSLQLAMAHQALGGIYLEQQRAGDAEGELRQALEIDRGSADTLYLLGKSQAAQGKLEEAVQSYRLAVRLVPDFADAFRDLSQVYEQQGNRDRAAYARGMVAYAAGDLHGAAGHLSRALEALPEMAEAHLGLAMVYEKGSRRDQAIEEYRKAVALDGSSIAARQGLVRLSPQ